MRQCLCFVIYKYQLSLKCLSPLQLLLRLWVPGKEKEKEEEEEEEEQKNSCKRIAKDNVSMQHLETCLLITKSDRVLCHVNMF